MGNIVPDKTSIEHDSIRKAKRVISVDPFGGLVTSGNLTTLIDEADASTTYIGKAQIGTASSASEWQIKKISVSGNITTIAYAEGDDRFNLIWDNRTGYSYS